MHLVLLHGLHRCHQQVAQLGNSILGCSQCAHNIWRSLQTHRCDHTFNAGPIGPLQATTITTYRFGGPIGRLPANGTLIFAGPKASITLFGTGNATVLANAAAAVGLTASSSPGILTYDVSICYSASTGGGLIDDENRMTLIEKTDVQPVRRVVSAVRQFTVPRGATYSVGLCVAVQSNIGLSNGLNNNNYVQGYAVVLQ